MKYNASKSVFLAKNFFLQIYFQHCEVKENKGDLYRAVTGCIKIRDTFFLRPMFTTSGNYRFLFESR
jgi:hypothetical protein